MNTAATRRQLPRLLQAAPPSPSPRWHRPHHIRGLWTGSRPLAEDENEKGNHTKTKQNGEPRRPSIFEDIFPDEDLSAFPYRRNQKQEQRRDNRDPDGSSSSKVRIITSTHVDKSEVTEWRAAKKAARAARLVAHRNKRHEAALKIPNLLAPNVKPWGLETSDIPALGSKLGEDDGSNSREAVETSKRGPSLFDELFKSDDPPKAATMPMTDDRHVDHGDLQAWIDSLPREEQSAPPVAGREWPAMLILSNASTNLSESDFYRVGPQGQHLDGWGASINKVMQAYDHNTLRPLGRYFILFGSRSAAASYQAEAQRRYDLTRHALQSSAAPLTAPSKLAANAFTLVPPSRAPLKLHLHRLDRATEARIESSSVQGLLSITPDPPPRACSQVILSLEGGTLDQRSLLQWVKRDARDRNLGWPVQHMRPYFPPKVYRQGVADGSEAQEYEWDEDTAPRIIDPEKDAKRSMDVTARSALFVLSFPDAHEARRFTRAWHRKELPRPRGHSVVVSTYFVW